MAEAISSEFASNLDQLFRRANQQLGDAGRRVVRFIDENRQTVLASSALLPQSTIPEARLQYRLMPSR